MARGFGFSIGCLSLMVAWRTRQRWCINATWTGPNPQGRNPFPHLFAILFGVTVCVDIEHRWLANPPKQLQYRKGY